MLMFRKQWAEIIVGMEQRMSPSRRKFYREKLAVDLHHDGKWWFVLQEGSSKNPDSPLYVQP
jgi:hypothetical protein